MNDKRQGVLLEWMLDKIEKNGRVDGSSFFCVFECEVQVGTSTATTVACQRIEFPGFQSFLDFLRIQKAIRHLILNVDVHLGAYHLRFIRFVKPGESE